MAPGEESGWGENERFGDIRHFEATDSTNAHMTALARAGAPGGIVVVTDYQRAGRGRRGRTWTAPPGTALLASVLVRPALTPSAAPLLGLAAAVAAVEACQDVADVAPSLKWPNDVVVESPAQTGIRAAAARMAAAAGPAPKLAGLLAESLVDGDELQAVVIGMGCNLRQAIVDDCGGSATPIAHNSTGPAAAAYLEDLAGRPVDRDDILHAWLARLDGWCSTLEAPGGELAVVEAYRRRCSTLGRLVRVELAARSFEGRATDITEQGHLVVESATARRTVTAGDVVHLRPASDLV